MPVDAEAAVETTATDGKPAGSRKTVIIAWLRRLLMVVVIAGAGWTISKHWSTVAATAKTLPWTTLVLSELAVITGIALGLVGWRWLVDDLGPHVGLFRSAQINLVGSLGKYIPGSVWAYLLQMELGRKAGVGRARVVTASLIQFGLGMVVTATFGLLALPSLHGRFPGAVVFAVIVPVGLVALHPKILAWGTNRLLALLRKPPLPHPPHFRVIGAALSIHVVAYGFFGLHLWLLAQAVGAAPGFAGFFLCTAAICIGLNAGMFVFVLPSGAGIRDGVIVAVLISSLAYPQALAFAVVSRVMFVVADLATAGLAAWFARGQVPLTAVAKA
jgi:uncharacterized membrane protein YbhN (UPF0104 family)